jgi:hypothetical protein
MSLDHRLDWGKNYEQLTKLLEAHWPRAIAGNHESANICLRALELQSRIIGVTS